MSTRPDQQIRTHYTSLADALLDAERVLGDLVDAIEDPRTLWPEPAELDFLARRAQKLVAAARQRVTKAGAC